MKKLLLLIATLFVAVLPALAQDSPVYDVLVNVDSAFVRAAPSQDAEPVASVFRDEPLKVTARSLDGSWYAVRRPGRLTNLGWVFKDIVKGERFLPESLPLGDLTTGATGPTPLTIAPTYAVYIQEGVALRTAPSLRAELITNIPPLVTVPVLARNQDGTWLQVNYLGYEGWMIGFTARRVPYLLDIPEAANLPALETNPVIIIPLEVQQAQVDRLREFVLEQRERARIMETFWWEVFRGVVKPCEPPPEVQYYLYGDQDVRELPELQRYTPRLREGVDKVNAAIDTLRQCGVISPDAVVSARNNAINARVIFEAALGQIDNVEELINRRRPRPPRATPVPVSS